MSDERTQPIASPSAASTSGSRLRALGSSEPEGSPRGVPGAPSLPGPLAQYEGQAAERPELLVGGAFVAAFLIGRVLRRIID